MPWRPGDNQHWQPQHRTCRVLRLLTHPFVFESTLVVAALILLLSGISDCAWGTPRRKHISLSSLAVFII